MKFEKDVFISYAHLDDKPLDEGTKGWITDFHKLLETRLEQTTRSSYGIDIWRDEKPTGNEVKGYDFVSNKNYLDRKTGWQEKRWPLILLLTCKIRYLVNWY